MKTQLYNMNNEIMTLEDVRNWYGEKNNSDLPISDNEMVLIIHTDLKYIIKIINDDILNWCNKYAEAVDVDRYLSKEERDESIKLIYQSIRDNDSILLPDVKKIISEGVENSQEDFITLKKELEVLESNTAKVTKKKRSGR